MKALILRNDADAAVATGRALIEQGCQILSVDSQAVAHTLIRVDAIDLLVMDETVEGQLTHAIGLSGERKNPYLSTILISDRPAAETDDLFALIPSLYSIVGTETAPEVIGQLAVTASAVDAAKAARILQNQAEDIAEASQETEDDELADVAAVVKGVMAAVEEADAAAELAAPSETPALILNPSDLAAPEVDDPEGGAPCYADVAIAAPALKELAAHDHQLTLERVNEVVMAEVAALFRKNQLPHLQVAEHPVAADAH